MAWILIIIAGVLETGFAVALKSSAGFTGCGPASCSSSSLRAASPC
jgi:multidrug transporter EmrE-like cation transporter